MEKAMNKAQKVIDIMNELAGNKISSADDLKSGQNVIFAKDHPNAGKLGIIIGPTKGEPGKVDLKIGKQTSVGIDIKDLLTVESPGAGVGSKTGKGDSGSPVGSNGDQVGKPTGVGAYQGDAGKYGKSGSPGKTAGQ